MKIENAIELVKEKLPEKRFKHSLRVAETAVKLAEIYDGDKDKAELAGVLHDYCKYDDLSTMYQTVRQYDLESDLLSYGGEILHGPVCSAIMENDFDVKDEEVLLAIKYHTTGRQQMTKTEKLVFIADYIEPGRKTPGVEEIRDMAYNQGSLDKTIYEISKRTVLFLIQKDITVYGATIACLNYYNYSDERIKDD
ncbi:bis(5'-nucleosyl)-tetraphosphatase (symmetrical) YqeK [Staphylococcus pasteuri]|uniref:bis(5'-nucleosyl)-tetraphosphatase (symmetrical) n=2 Tax=Staphylococcus TaxID=1279 RepID=A0ABY1H054_9STAP|nr:MULTISPECIES: bis(5'-nucleosyl)-tetraphosphatase (symmetrical) YqeK [Staphylococcus]ATH62512.1 HAD family hydrolase [Staphylococcus pasteuri]KKI57524.1 Hydrolase (HAD superfamily), YqeK [Staphylococcus pasteuri]MBL3397662.1 bis(5'-nucleosyl)-tetraphosphatase (symmetrical) YqeK [Staphylococcus pasteuri]MBM6507477.1 bis(5'-nucleosyl)-tetraphosphatase (symmetrical) YqeK [Staphylococcus pasteuri]MCD9066343.1 bis(5'-nucleosyl)-tetraphosphatase (symmetrical) YqeK [Staphylococcus pasteuri]